MSLNLLHRRSKEKEKEKAREVIPAEGIGFRRQAGCPRRVSKSDAAPASVRVAVGGRGSSNVCCGGACTKKCMFR